MCGRYALFVVKGVLIRQYHVDQDTADVRKRYNMAPTQTVPVVRRAGSAREMLDHWWGFPVQKAAKTIINARAETVASKPLFKSAFEQGRIIVPASGFYEWADTPEGRTPHFIQRRDGQPMAFAGIARPMTWKDGSKHPSMVILTTPASRWMSMMHDRMPAILENDEVDDWLAHGKGTTARAKTLLDPAEEDTLVSHPVGRHVNKTENEGPHLVDEVKPTARQTRLP